MAGAEPANLVFPRGGNVPSWNGFWWKDSVGLQRATSDFCLWGRLQQGLGLSPRMQRKGDLHLLDSRA